MTNEDNKLVGKIKKLLALAGNNPNQEEAKSAMLKAQQLMAENNIEVSIDEADKIEYGMEIAKTKMNKAFRFGLAGIIATNFRCRAIILRSSTDSPIGFFGHKADTAICKEVFEFAYNAAKRNGDAEYGRYKREGLETKNVFNSYVAGFIKGLGQALAAQSTSLMVIVPQDVKEEFHRQFQNTTTHKGDMRMSESVGVNIGAFSKGVSDGREILKKRSIES